jgi:hypothetical protein
MISTPSSPGQTTAPSVEWERGLRAKHGAKDTDDSIHAFFALLQNSI